jgi:hypothetical protein
LRKRKRDEAGVNNLSEGTKKKQLSTLLSFTEEEDEDAGALEV